MAVRSTAKVLRSRGADVEITIAGRSGRRGPGALVAAPAPKPSAFDVVFGLVDGLARSIVWLALMAVLLLLVAIGLLIAGVVTWVSASAILNLQDWAAWAVTIFVEACAVILIVGYARK